VLPIHPNGALPFASGLFYSPWFWSYPSGVGTTTMDYRIALTGSLPFDAWGEPVEAVPFN